MRINEVTVPGSPKLDDATFAQLEGPLMSTWQAIAPDLYQNADATGTELDNISAVEACVCAEALSRFSNPRSPGDRSSEGDAAQALFSALCKAHGFSNVVRWLASKVELA